MYVNAAAGVIFDLADQTAVEIKAQFCLGPLQPNLHKTEKKGKTLVSFSLSTKDKDGEIQKGKGYGDGDEYKYRGDQGDLIIQNKRYES